jgi:hypothetical protein
LPRFVVPLLSTISPLPPDDCEKPLPINTAPVSPDTALPLLNTTKPLLPMLFAQPVETVIEPLLPE